jgi:Mn2+/Fe2+ NRAMP family transporter
VAGFYGVIAAATLLGIGIDWSPITPIKALFWSAVINGVVAVPVMATMMLVVSRHCQMGRFVVRPALTACGWGATALMAAAAIAMLALSL